MLPRRLSIFPLPTGIVRARRWWCKTFRTRELAAMYNRHEGRILTVEEWKGWEDALRPGWMVERRNWWDSGWSGIRAETAEEARARLDEWQDDMWRRSA